VSRVLIAVWIAFVLAACASTAPPAGTIPTVSEAQDLLDELVGLARTGDFDGLCRVSDDGNCERLLANAGRDAVPPDPPTIVATRIMPTTRSGDQLSPGGVVFVLCGTNAFGDHYDSEMLVFHDGGGLRALNPIYWGPTRIGDSANPITAETFPPVTC
jgi:hypothetical protein